MLRDALIIYRKEMKNLVKDRRTLMIILVLPLVILPAIFGTLGAVTEQQQQEAASTLYGVTIEHIDDPRFAAILGQRLQYASPSESTEVDLTISFPEAYRPGQPAKVSVYFDSRSNKSSFAANQIAGALNGYSDLLASETLAEHELSLSDIRSISVERFDTAPEEAQGSGILSMLLPYMILIYIFSGSMNIGLDTTAGEKERGSLASVLVNQVSRTSIALGKIFYVVTAALMTSVSSFAGIMIAFRIGGLGGSGEVSANLAVLSAGNVIGLLLTLLSISTLAASIVVLLGSIARNMKEGGGYILPVYLVVIMIGIASMQMDAADSAQLFLIPLVNTVFLMKEILLGQLSLAHILITLGVNLVATGVFVRITAGLFNSERILNTT